MSREASARYYQQNNNKKKIQKNLVKYIKILLAKKNKRYKNISEDKKQRLVEYRKRYYKMQKNSARSLNKVLVSSYKGKNVTILGHPRFQF